jgi:predicted DNA-binding transcriptional regulator YafY
MNVKRITRLPKLLQTLRSGNGQNADDVAKSCGVSRRTMFRDLTVLRQSGVRIEFDVERDGYSIPGAHFLPPVNFTAAEALSLMSMAIVLGRDGHHPFHVAAYSAAVKLEGILPPPIRAQLRDMTRTIRVRPTPLSATGAKRGIDQRLADARARHRAVQVEYDSFTEWERITNELHVYQLLFCRNGWYAIG